MSESDHHNYCNRTTSRYGYLQDSPRAFSISVSSYLFASGLLRISVRTGNTHMPHASLPRLP
jgi:hypothetical protein